MTPIIEAVHLQDWYAAAALLLTLAVQIVRKSPVLKGLWQRIPDGWRWVVPIVSGAATGFTSAFSDGMLFADALLAAIGGALAIGVPSMGAAAWLKESPVKWDGSAGGKKPPIAPSVMFMAFALVIPFALLSSCKPGAVDWPEVAKCAPAPSTLVDKATSILFQDGSGSLSDRAVNALEQLAREYAPGAVACVVAQLVDAWTGKIGADAVTIAAAARGEAFLDRVGTKTTGPPGE